MTKLTIQTPRSDIVPRRERGAVENQPPATITNATPRGHNITAPATQAERDTRDRVHRDYRAKVAASKVP